MWARLWSTHAATFLPVSSLRLSLLSVFGAVGTVTLSTSKNPVTSRVNGIGGEPEMRRSKVAVCRNPPQNPGAGDRRRGRPDPPVTGFEGLRPPAYTPEGGDPAVRSIRSVPTLLVVLGLWILAGSLWALGGEAAGDRRFMYAPGVRDAAAPAQASGDPGTTSVKRYLLWNFDTLPGDDWRTYSCLGRSKATVAHGIMTIDSPSDCFMVHS